MAWDFYVKYGSCKIIPHFTISFLMMSGSNVNINKVLNVYVAFRAVLLYIAIFKVIEGRLRESITGFLYKITNILCHRNVRRASTKF